MPKQVKYIDLFCGLGAFHTAFNKNSNENIEYKCVLACDTVSYTHLTLPTN